MSNQSAQQPKATQPTVQPQNRRASGRLAKNPSNTDNMAQLDTSTTDNAPFILNTKRRRTGEALPGPQSLDENGADPQAPDPRLIQLPPDEITSKHVAPPNMHDANGSLPTIQNAHHSSSQEEPDDDEIEKYLQMKKRRTDDGVKDPMAMDEDTSAPTPVTPSPSENWMMEAATQGQYPGRVSATPFDGTQRSVSSPILSPPPEETSDLDKSMHAPARQVSTRLPYHHTKNKKLTPYDQNTEADRAAVTKLVMRLRRNNEVATEAKSPVKKEESVPPQPLILAIPREQRPRIIGRYTAHLLENINWVDIAQWMDPGSPYTLLTILGHGNYPPHILAEIASELNIAIREITGSTTVSVFAPSAATDTLKLNLPPFTFVARDIDTLERDKLLDLHIVNCKGISFVCNVTSFDPDTHVGSIDGYNVKPDDDFRRAGIEDFVKDLMMTHVGGALADMLLSDEGLAELTPIARARAVIDKLTISPITISFPNKPNDPGRTVWNLILEQPDIYDEDWLQLQTLITAIRWNSPQFGPGVSHAGWTCHYCHSTTHPTGLCPFSKIEGWRPSLPIQSISNFTKVYEIVGIVAFGMAPEELNAEARRFRSLPPTRGTNTRGRARGNIYRGGPSGSRGRGTPHAALGYLE